jgi:ATP-dependent 26S proteasome regulatory subunit
LLQKLVEHGKVSFLGVTRHYMSLNVKILDIGLFDTLVEMQAPNKEQRYQIVREMVADEKHRGREVWMQRVAQMMEYFMVRDIVEIVKQVDRHQGACEGVEGWVQKHKEAYFPAS